MIKTDEHLYTMSRSEFAKSIGKSRDAVKIGMRRGKYKDDYIFNGIKYLFKPREAMRVFQGASPVTKIVKRPNRGNHFKGKYPNDSFRKHNELKMLAKLKGVTDPEVLENLPKAIEIAKQEKQTRIKKNIIDSIPKNYGGLNPPGTIISFRTEWRDLFPRQKDEYELALEKIPKVTKTYY